MFAFFVFSESKVYARNQNFWTSGLKFACIHSKLLIFIISTIETLSKNIINCRKTRENDNSKSCRKKYMRTFDAKLYQTKRRKKTDCQNCENSRLKRIFMFLRLLKNRDFETCDIRRNLIFVLNDNFFYAEMILIWK